MWCWKFGTKHELLVLILAPYMDSIHCEDYTCCVLFDRVYPQECGRITPYEVGIDYPHWTLLA